MVPEGVHLDALLDLFRERRTQIAIVVDEYGSTAGLVTFENIIEEVTGEVQDALEPSERPVQYLENGTLLVRGSLRLDELNELLGWELEEDSVDTVAGMIMNRLSRIASVGDEVETTVRHLSGRQDGESPDHGRDGGTQGSATRSRASTPKSNEPTERIVTWFGKQGSRVMSMRSRHPDLEKIERAKRALNAFAFPSPWSPSRSGT